MLVGYLQPWTKLLKCFFERRLNSANYFNHYLSPISIQKKTMLNRSCLFSVLRRPWAGLGGDGLTLAHGMDALDWVGWDGLTSARARAVIKFSTF